MARNEITDEEAEALLCELLFLESCDKKSRQKHGLPDPLTFPTPPEVSMEPRNEPIQDDGSTGANCTLVPSSDFNRPALLPGNHHSLHGDTKMTTTIKKMPAYSSLIGAPIPYGMGDDEFRCPHCKALQQGHWWISLTGDCMACGLCWSDAFIEGDDGTMKSYTDPGLELLFTSVAEELERVEAKKQGGLETTPATAKKHAVATAGC